MIVFRMIPAVTTIVFIMYPAPFWVKLLKIEEKDRM
jgi:hypothetical protein